MSKITTLTPILASTPSPEQAAKTDDISVAQAQAQAAAKHAALVAEMDALLAAINPAQAAKPTHDPDFALRITKPAGVEVITTAANPDTGTPEQTYMVFVLAPEQVRDVERYIMMRKANDDKQVSPEQAILDSWDAGFRQRFNQAADKHNNRVNAKLVSAQNYLSERLRRKEITPETYVALSARLENDPLFQVINRLR